MSRLSGPIETLFDTSDFPARWHCGRWTDLHGWTHVVADFAIFAAYAAIPVVLLVFARKRQDFPFQPIFLLFSLFILSCGIGHFIEATIFWHPWYRLSALAKVVTAVVSWATVIALTRVVPKALELPGLAKVNAELQKEAEIRRGAEEKLEASRERFELAVAGSNDGIWDWNVASGEDYFSDRWCELLGFEPGELRAHVSSWTSLIHPEDADRVMDAVQKHLLEREPYNEEMRLRNRDGSYRWYLARGQAVWDEDGVPLRMAGSLSDVTERRQAEVERERLMEQLRETNRQLELRVAEKAELNATLESQVMERTRSLEEATRAAEDSNRAKGRFLANMSHEIRTPMNAVIGLLQLLQRTELSATQSGYARQAEAAAGNLLGVLNDILDLSKIEAGKLSVSSRPFSTKELFNELAAYPPVILGDKDLDVVFDIAPTMPAKLLGDSLRIRQVLLNVLSNAIKFTDKGQVVLAARGKRKDGNFELEVRVSDSGVGISAKNQEKLFRPFEQVQQAATRKYGGTGLGLTITRELTQMMKGQLSVESRPGEGSTFRFEFKLPIRDDAPLSKPAELASWILVAQKGLRARACHAKLAKHLSEQVCVVSDGDDILQLAKTAPRAEKPGIILLDVRLATVSLLERLRAELPHLDIDLVSPRHLQADDVRTHYCRRTLVMPMTPMRLEHILRGASRDAKGGRTSAESLKETNLSGLHVLVVDDVDTNLLVVEQVLRNHGAQITTAGNGVEAVELANDPDKQFDIILMDIQMPELDGNAAARRIRLGGVHGEKPIVALTADAIESNMETSLAAGMNDYLSKPFSVDSLVAKVSRWCQPSSS